MFKQRHHILLPILLTALGLWLLSGCIYIPTFDKVTAGRNAAKDVGDARSKKPIRVDFATRDDVIRILGQPPFTSPDRSRVAYSWSVKRGVMAGICGVQDHEGERALVLQFDSSHVLRGFEVRRKDGPLFSLGTVLLSPPLDRDMQPNPAYDRWWEFRQRRGAWRPAPQTQP